MQGRRLPNTIWPVVLPHDLEHDFESGELIALRDGDYWKVIGAPEGGETWCLYWGGAARVPDHIVDEHEDGTISITPQPNPPGVAMNSVLVDGGRPFHGYIDHGVWRAI